MSENKERTLILLKPDALQRGLVGRIIQRFEDKGLILCAMKMTVASEDVIKQHYNDIMDKPFFPRFLKYVTSSPVIVMVSLMLIFAPYVFHFDFEHLFFLFVLFEWTPS